jgi:hypothetical protein
MSTLSRSNQNRKGKGNWKGVQLSKHLDVILEDRRGSLLPRTTDKYVAYREYCTRYERRLLMSEILKLPLATSYLETIMLRSALLSVHKINDCSSYFCITN